MELVGNYRCNWNKPGICVHWRITKFPRFSLRHITSNDVIRPTKRITDASIMKRQQRYPELLLQRLLCHCCNRHQADVVQVLFSYEHLRTMGFFPRMSCFRIPYKFSVTTQDGRRSLGRSYKFCQEVSAGHWAE